MTEFEESKSRKVEESEVEDALSLLARVESAPELGEARWRRASLERAGDTLLPHRRWAWGVGVAVAAGVMAICSLTAEPRRHQGTKGRVERLEPQTARMTQMAPPRERPREPHSGELSGRKAGEPQRHKRTKQPAAREGFRRPASVAQVPEPAEGRVSGPDRAAAMAEANPDALQDLPAAGSQVENLRYKDVGVKGEEQAPFDPTQGRPAEREAPARPTSGVVLVLGRAEPVLPSGSCYIEVTRADGTTTAAEQAVERDAAGRPQMVRLSHDWGQAEAAVVRQGG
ncbi:MAG: hypothetical protein ACE149_00290 [Armatimonadota bacterium]